MFLTLNFSGLESDRQMAEKGPGRPRSNWFKVWSEPWLRGSTRDELTDAQRAVFVDLLALANTCRTRGLIASGCNDDGQPVPYSWDRMAVAMGHASAEYVRNCVLAFEKFGKVTVTPAKAPNGEDSAVVQVVNWEHYQSEAERVMKSRQKSKQAKSDQNPALEADIVDEEFERFWRAYPNGRRVNRKGTERAWDKIPDAERPAVLSGLEAWKACDQWQDHQFVPHPTTFLNQERWKSEPPKGGSRERAKIDRSLAALGFKRKP